MLLIFLPFIAFSQNVWETVYTFEPINQIQNIVCIDSNKLYVGTSYGDVLYSSNSGLNWEYISHKKLNFSLSDISVIDSNNLFLLYDRKYINKSTDGGKSYELLNITDSQMHLNSDFKMYNNQIGVIENISVLFTKDSWKTVDSIGFGVEFYGPLILDFKNDSIIYIVYVDLYDWSDWYPPNIENFDKYYFGSYNLNSKSLTKLSKLKADNNSDYHFNDMIVDNDTIILAGYNSKIGGGILLTDAIIKSTDGGRTWSSILDLFFKVELNSIKYNNPTDIREISFKNDSIGIAVGKYGKILYTYDSGKSWYLEMIKHPNVNGTTSMFINYESGEAIMGIDNSYIMRLKEDYLAPQPQDTFTIDGYISGESKAIKNIPVALDNRITMTDSNGYYRFTKVRGTNFELKVLNKYYNYIPYAYEPNIIKPTITKDTMFNFVATDIRNYYNVSGSIILENKGLKDIIMQLGSNTVTTDEDGFYNFENIEEWEYKLTPITEGYTYEPEFYDITLNEHFTSMNFVASPITSVKDNPNYTFRDNILYSKEIVGHTYRLIDLQSRVIKSSNLSQTIDFNYLDSGTYILQITKNNSDVFSEKFQVVR